jgi:hypothetical protein
MEKSDSLPTMKISYARFSIKAYREKGRREKKWQNAIHAKHPRELLQRQVKF